MDEGITRHRAENNRIRTRAGRTALWSAVVAMLAMAVGAASAFAGSGGLSSTSGSGGTGTGGGSGINARYAKVWEKFKSRDHHWAHKTSQCESGQNPRAIGGGGRYRGAFQFTRPTWKTSPKSPGGDPIRYSWKTQAVVAVLLKHREGRKPWPVCG